MFFDVMKEKKHHVKEEEVEGFAVDETKEATCVEPMRISHQ